MAAFMQQLVQFLEGLFTAIPLPILEIWGRLAYFIGLLLALFAFGGFTFTPRGRWGLGRIRQNWNSRALLCAGLSFAAVPLAGWLGSQIVLVEGAQTFESLKDVVVFLCIVLFGYPALLAVPPAYMLSDLIEGVPPSFVFDWFLGYFAWAAFVWMAAQLIGRRPDFRRVRVWRGYLTFVLFLMAFDPVMWGFICARQFTPEISYTVVTPALAATLCVTWFGAPLFMLAAFPLAARGGLFWARLRGFVRERRMGSGAMVHSKASRGLPLRLVLAGSFVALTLALVGGVAFVAVQSGQRAAEQLATALHTEVASTLNLQLDAYLDSQTQLPLTERLYGVAQVLARSSIADKGRIYMIDRQGRLLAASSDIAQDRGVAQAGLARLNELGWTLAGITTPQSFRFPVVNAKPLAREMWLAQVTPYADNKQELDVLVITAMPESHYLASVQAGGSRAATLSALALTAALALAALLAGLVAKPIEHLAHSARALARGELRHRVPAGALEEVNGLVQAFNSMAEQLQALLDRSRESEAELLALNAGLDLRVRDRTAELQTALDELHRTKDQLVQSEKLAGLGHIVARVAHEMNTPLGIAVTSGSTLQDQARGLQAKVESGQLRRSELVNFLGTLRTGLDLTLGALHRAHCLVSDFKQVAVDQGSEHRRRFQLHECVNATRSLLDISLRRTPYELLIDVPEGIQMDSYPGAIEQLLINLFNNALLHAFDGREQGHLSFSAEQAGTEVVMVFEDDGVGMSEAVRRRVYDPFFTTKAGSGGSGLGLTICFNLVTGSLGGQMEVHSCEGEGTRFIIRAPCTAPRRELAATA